MRVAGVALGLAIAVAFSTLVAQPASAEAACQDYHFYAARGTGPADPPFGAVGDVNSQAIETIKTAMRANGENSFETTTGIDYPAASVPANWFNSNPYGNGSYFDSVQQGADEVQSQLHDLAVRCGTQTKAVLLGYSQGADVMGVALPQLTSVQRNLVAGVLTFGDPGFNGHDKTADFGTFTATRSGFRGGRPAWSTLVNAPSVSMCRQWDAICQLRLDVKHQDGVHSDYSYGPIAAHNDFGNVRVCPRFG